MKKDGTALPATECAKAPVKRAQARPTGKLNYSPAIQGKIDGFRKREYEKLAQKYAAEAEAALESEKAYNKLMEEVAQRPTIVDRVAGLQALAPSRGKPLPAWRGPICPPAPTASKSCAG